MRSLISFFMGTWSLERHVSAPAVTIKGWATFTPAEDHLVYHEQGYWHTQDCYQTYRYKEHPGFLVIEKRDGGVLHEFALPHIRQFPLVLQHTHNCGQDQYDCHLLLYEDGAFEIAYNVRGPKKDYQMRTRLVRGSGG